MVERVEPSQGVERKMDPAQGPGAARRVVPLETSRSQSFGFGLFVLACGIAFGVWQWDVWGGVWMTLLLLVLEDVSERAGLQVRQREIMRTMARRAPERSEGLPSPSQAPAPEGK